MSRSVGTSTHPDMRHMWMSCTSPEAKSLIGTLQQSFMTGLVLTMRIATDAEMRSLNRDFAQGDKLLISSNWHLPVFTGRSSAVTDTRQECPEDLSNGALTKFRLLPLVTMTISDSVSERIESFTRSGGSPSITAHFPPTRTPPWAEGLPKNWALMSYSGGSFAAPVAAYTTQAPLLCVGRQTLPPSQESLTVFQYDIWVIASEPASASQQKSEVQGAEIIKEEKDEDYIPLDLLSISDTRDADVKMEGYKQEDA